MSPSCLVGLDVALHERRRAGQDWDFKIPAGLWTGKIKHEFRLASPLLGGASHRG